MARRRPLASGFELHAGYELEVRSSNEPGKAFSDHTTSLTLGYRW